jgi:hypothetical protein
MSTQESTPLTMSSATSVVPLEQKTLRPLRDIPAIPAITGKPTQSSAEPIDVLGERGRRRARRKSLTQTAREDSLHGNPDGSFAAIVEDLSQPTSLEFIGNRAYIVSLAGDIRKVEGVSSPPYGASR